MALANLASIRLPLSAFPSAIGVSAFPSCMGAAFVQTERFGAEKAEGRWGGLGGRRRGDGGLGAQLLESLRGRGEVPVGSDRDSPTTPGGRRKFQCCEISASASIRLPLKSPRPHTELALLGVELPTLSQAPIAYISVVAVKKVVVRSSAGGSGPPSVGVHWCSRPSCREALFLLAFAGRDAESAMLL